MAHDAGSPDESTGEFEELGPARHQPPFHLEIGAMSHPGLTRENNEDNYYAARLSRSLEVENTSLASVGGVRRSEGVGHVLIVADGMGGVAGGELASALAVETLEAFMRNSFRSFLHQERTHEGALFRELKTGIERADKAVIALAQGNPKLDGLGTTLTMAYGIADNFYILHVGDSRAYHVHDGKLRQVTTDHTFVQTLVKDGMISPEEAKTHARRNVVTNIVGGPDEGVYAETHKVTLANGDILLLCSDGLTEVVEDAVIESILEHESSPRVAVRTLIDKALELGGPDNVTVIIAKAHVGP